MCFCDAIRRDRSDGCNKTSSTKREHTMTTTNPIAVVQGYFDAYRDKQWARLAEVFADDLQFQHHNRNFVCTSAEETIAVLKTMGETLIPDRRYTTIHRMEAFGELVVVEATWEATAIQEIPGFAKLGEKIKFDFCSLFVVKAGRIVQWDDYG
jgi:limonene-1,2-epoxide hydrolase